MGVFLYVRAKEMKNVKIVHRNYPLDTECNPYLQAPFHVGSCVDARYSVAAEKQGRLWEMNEILFENKPQTEEVILKLAKKAKFDTQKLQEDANSTETFEKIKADIDFAAHKGINGTPTTMINNEAYVGVKTYKEFKEWVKKYGAEER